MKRVLRSVLAVVAATACAWAVQSQASVVIGATRVIFPSTEREVTVRVNNVGATPSLVQTWLDTGDAGASPDKIDVPFTLTPAMFRLDPGKGQTMRMIYSKTPLATDKETLFWLNVLEIPPKPKAEDAGGTPNQLQLAFRSRIKVFFRPQGLPGKPEEAPAQVKWQVVHNPDGYHLKATNPTPYFVNFGSLALVSGGQTVDAGPGYVAPGESQEFAVPGLKGSPQPGAKVEFRAINDFGAGVQNEATLTN